MNNPGPSSARGLDAAALAAMLVGLWLLVELELATLLAWTARCFPVARYPLLFAAYFLTWLAVRAARGPAGRRAALVGGSLACGAIVDVGFLAASLIWIALLHRVLFSGARRRVAHAWLFVGVTFAALAVACNRDLWPGLVAERPWLARWGYVFAVGYTFRVAWLLHQVRVQRTAALPLVDCVAYLTFAPFFLIVPYMIAIPRCDRFCAGLDRHDLAVERSGLRLIAWGIALSLAHAGIVAVYPPETLGYRAWLSGAYPEALVHGLLAYPPLAIVHACAIAAILIGLVRVLGIDLGPSFDRPALARSVTEWWRRWNTHFRDLLVDIFYLPVVMRHRRAPVRGIVVGCAAVFLVGSVLFHWPKLYFAHGRVAALPVGILAESLVMFAIVTVALVRERRPGARPPGRVTGALTTWILVFAAVCLAGRAAHTTWAAHALPGAAPVMSDTPRSLHVFPEP
jgi:D-alanyl-lipoteichoic acid acyltransferase DltB (MBOAT superfamily)